MHQTNEQTVNVPTASLSISSLFFCCLFLSLPGIPSLLFPFLCISLCFLLHNSLYICLSLSNRYSLIKMVLGSFLRHLPQVGFKPIHYTPSPCACSSSFSPIILSSFPPLALLNSPHPLSLPAQSGLIHRKLSKCNNPTERLCARDCMRMCVDELYDYTAFEGGKINPSPSLCFIISCLFDVLVSHI